MNGEYRIQKFRFLKWHVYKDAKLLYANTLSFLKELPREHRFDIGTQLSRSSLSIILNIAEGSGKHSDKDFGRYIDIALGSLH